MFTLTEGVGRMSIKNSLLSFAVCAALSMPIISSPDAMAAKGGDGFRNKGDFGVGIVLGEPTGGTGKFWVGNTQAIDFGIAATFKGDLIVGYADYLFHFPQIFGVSSRFLAQLSGYVGPGLILGIDNVTASDVSVGGRIPFGTEWLPYDTPVGVFLEVVPNMSFTNGVAFKLYAGLGIRYYF